MKKGFTLIELLAVIVILAIIALIAVPIVLNIINDSKKSSNEESIKMYGSALENAIGNYLLKHPGDRNVTLENLDGYINYSGSIVECKTTKIYNNGKVYLKGCTVGGEEVDYKYGDNFIKLVEDTQEKGPSVGDKYTYQVNDDYTFTFYILKIEGNEVHLIMDRNICEDGSVKYTEENNYCRYYWDEKNNYNGYGPVIAMEKLYAGTKDWSNVPDMIINYTDENLAAGKGYTSIVTSNGVTTITGKSTSNTVTTATVGTSSAPLKARLPKYIEVSEAGCTGSSGSCPVWLMENMTYYNASNDKYSMNNNTEAYQDKIYGYWLLSSSGSTGGSRYAFCIFNDGGIRGNINPLSNNIGIRPVITVLKSDLS